jgi:hypothetical protein
MGWIVVGCIAAALFALLVWICGFKGALLSFYYTVKYVIVKLLEVAVRIIVAFVQTPHIFMFIMCWVVVTLFCWLVIPEMYLVQGIIDLIFLALLIKMIIPELRNWGSKVMVQKWFFRFERPLCFGNKELTCYPQYWFKN